MFLDDEDISDLSPSKIPKGNIIMILLLVIFVPNDVDFVYLFILLPYCFESIRRILSLGHEQRVLQRSLRTYI